MSDQPRFEFRSIRDQRIFKLAAVMSYVFAIGLAATALTLRFTDQIENMVFNIMMIMAAMLLVEAVILPKILKRAKGAKYKFFDDHMKYIFSSQRNFTIPYNIMRGVRSKPITKTQHYKNIPVSDIFIKLDQDQIPNFSNTVIRKGELILPAVPDSEGVVRRISDLIGGQNVL